jgi:integrase
MRLGLLHYLEFAMDRFQKLLKDSNIARHRFHDLRHTAATLLAVQGVHSRAIQAVLGWDQVAMVDRYAHFVNEMRKEAATKMGRDSKPRGCQHGCQTARTES